jgi:fido (protein-threonine AMPylation protein)
MNETPDLPPSDDEAEAPFTAQIARQFVSLNQWLSLYASSEMLDTELICWFHRYAFESAFPMYAGVLRGEDLPFEAEFGRFRGVSYRECERALDDLHRKIHRYMEQHAGASGADQQELGLQLAAIHHGEFIRIHPFVNGNGRTGRVWVNYFAARYGLTFVELQREHDYEYLEAIRAYLDRGRTDGLLDVLRGRMRPNRAAE